ncbi:MAG: CRTAC1 family protein [Acidobacteriota bacterium]
MKFVDVTNDVGIGVHGAGSVTWGDFNNDGYEDLLIGCGDLYINSGPPDFTFSKHTTFTGGNGGHWGDIDNDGDLDFFCTSGTNALWINNGDGTFSNQTDSSGLKNRGCSAYDGDCGCTSANPWCPWNSWPFTASAWGDYDADGYIDLYIGNYETWDGSTLYCWPDFFYKNNGNKTFTDVSWTSGVRDADGDGTQDEKPNEVDRRCVRGVTWGDYNNDNLNDIYISNYRIMPNTLWENQGSGKFKNVADSKGCAKADNVGDEGHTLGSDWGDMDNDGDIDLYEADLAHEIYWLFLGHDASALYRNNGPPDYNFTNIRPNTGMEQMSTSRNDWTETSPTWGDADNDGDIDIYVTQIYMYSSYYSKMYRNNGIGGDGYQKFTDMTNYYGDCPSDPKQPPAAGANCMKLWYSSTAAWADYDNDGDLDLAAGGNNYWVECSDSDGDGTGECQYINTPEPEKPDCNTADANTWCQPSYFHLFKNVTANSNHWLELNLLGTTYNNRAAIGARVKATVGSTAMMREVSGGTGYHSTQNSMRIHFGLGSSTVVNQLEIRWPDGTTKILSNVNADQIMTVCDQETISGLRFSSDKSTITWDPVSGAESYDIVKGDLNSLRSSHGDFSSSLTGCVENDSADTQTFDDSQPPAGEGFYYLARFEHSGGKKSTYDVCSTYQKGARDAEINASTNKCE